MQVGRPLIYADFVLLAALCLSPAHTQKKNKITFFIIHCPNVIIYKLDACIFWGEGGEGFCGGGEMKEH
jgi:hypothetical protein